MESVLLVNCRVPLFVMVFKLLPPSVSVEAAGKEIVLLAPITSDMLKPKVLAPAMDAEFVPANVKLPLIVAPLLTVSNADKVMVVVPEMVSVLQADATSTVGLFAVAGMVALSAAKGCPVFGSQLALLLQLVLTPVPVQE